MCVSCEQFPFQLSTAAASSLPPLADAAVAPPSLSPLARCRHRPRSLPLRSQPSSPRSAPDFISARAPLQPPPPPHTPLSPPPHPSPPSRRPPPVPSSSPHITASPIHNHHRACRRRQHPHPIPAFTASEANQPAPLLHRQAARLRRRGWRQARRRRRGEWRIQTLLHADTNPTNVQTLPAPRTPAHHPHRRRVSSVTTPGHPATVTPTLRCHPAAIKNKDASHSISVEISPLAGLQCRVVSGQQSSSSMAACKIRFKGVESRVFGRQLLLVQI
ncbi:hypothetical protein GQ55_9G287900 [Panicum hallii var. hallii]|uniref:Uncharacterized protein n=1 Tax=Panicum hallii var. hallii TaxID=1504633 RepID=A0A2T7C7M1_9POAL|nr:hypothetical protein GQ55_9G287900 [Panicum hallii var. hallii]